MDDGGLHQRRDEAWLESRALLVPHFERLFDERQALRRRSWWGDRHLVVEVPVGWPAVFDDQSSVLGLPVVRGDVDEPRVVNRG